MSVCVSFSGCTPQNLIKSNREEFSNIIYLNSKLKKKQPQNSKF